MARVVHISQIETLVDNYLKKFRGSNNIRSQRAILDKAAKLIGVVLEDPCCSMENVVSFSRRENWFIVQLRNLLNGIDVRKWRKSLGRARAKINFLLDQGCCPGEFIPAFPTVLWDEETGEFLTDTIAFKGCNMFNTTPGSNGWNTAVHWYGTFTMTMQQAVDAINEAVAVDPVGGSGLYAAEWLPEFAAYFPLTYNPETGEVFSAKEQDPNSPCQLSIGAALTYAQWPT